jgi:predicted membrane channel-forming protein YqfA (hemolysin III family)
MLSNTRKAETRFHLLGWLLFLVCAILFIIESVMARSTVGLVASVLFLAGCIAFLIPLGVGWSRGGQ